MQRGNKNYHEVAKKLIPHARNINHKGQLLVAKIALSQSTKFLAHLTAPPRNLEMTKLFNSDPCFKVPAATVCRVKSLVFTV